jgi:phage shock protein C
MGTHLYRSRDDRMLAGVAGGLAELWDADPSLVRIVWALLVVLTGGIALVIYIVMAIVVPEEPYDSAAFATPGAAAGMGAGTTAANSGTSPGAVAGSGIPSAGQSAPPDWRAQRSAARDQRRAARAARRAERGYDGRTGSVVIGAILVVIGLAFLVREYFPAIDFDYVWPLALVALGVVVILAAFRPTGRGNGPGGPA